MLVNGATAATTVTSPVFRHPYPPPTPSITYNRFTNVPNVESLAYSLTWLDLRNNLITAVESFTFANFTALRVLYLTSNSITFLPCLALHTPLVRFSQVFINANHLVTLGKLASAGMVAHHLYLDYNELTEFPCLANITLLRYYVYFRVNPIDIILVGCS